MKHNLGKYGALMLLTLTAALVPGIASADCRLDDGTSKEGAIGPAELLPSCAEFTEATRDARASQAKETSPNPRAQKISIAPVRNEVHEPAPAKQ